jgi:hypothetical protein
MFGEGSRRVFGGRGRIELCDTADWKSALRAKRMLTPNPCGHAAYTSRSMSETSLRFVVVLVLVVVIGFSGLLDYECEDDDEDDARTLAYSDTLLRRPREHTGCNCAPDEASAG